MKLYNKPFCANVRHLDRMKCILHRKSRWSCATLQLTSVYLCNFRDNIHYGNVTDLETEHSATNVIVLL